MRSLEVIPLIILKSNKIKMKNIIAYQKLSKKMKMIKLSKNLGFIQWKDIQILKICGRRFGT